MKLSALAAQIKNCGHCEVINNGGRIFVGTGSAFYCMDGYTRTQDAGELGAMLGIPQKKMKNIFYHEEYTIDGKLYGMILRALIAPMNIKDDVADDLDEIIAELMSRRQKQIVEKMHDDLQDMIAQEGAEKGKAND